MKKSNKIFFIVSLIFIIVFAIGNIAFAGLANTAWPMYKGNAKHTGLSPYNTNHVQPQEKWRFDTGQGVESSPAIGADGTIYVGSFRNNFFALNPDGEELWRFIREGEEFRTSPAIAEDGTIYLSSTYDHVKIYNILHGEDMDYGIPKLYALNPDGTVKWEFITGGIYSGTIGAPTVGPDGTIYIGSGGSKMVEEEKRGDVLYALNPDGTEKWSFNTGDAIFTSPALASDGTIYLASANYTFYALTAEGKEIWQHKAEGYFDGSPTIGPDNTIYAGNTDKTLYAYNPDGTIKWTFKVKDILEATPSIGPDGTIYVGVIDQSQTDKNLYALNPDGSLKWKFETGGGVYSTPAIGAEGTLFFGSYDGNIYALNPDGTERWRYNTGGAIVMPPALDKDGTIYVGNWKNQLVAIGGAKPESDSEVKTILNTNNNVNVAALNNNVNAATPITTASNKDLNLLYIIVPVLFGATVVAVIVLIRRTRNRY